MCRAGHSIPVGAMYCDNGHPPATEQPEPIHDPVPPARKTRRLRVTIDGQSAVSDAPVLLGRAQDAALSELLNDARRGYPNVSREHARVHLFNGVAIVTDLGSRNHTFVPDGRSERQLGEGDEQRLDLPVTIRLASNCRVRLEAEDEQQDEP